MATLLDLARRVERVANNVERIGTAVGNEAAYQMLKYLVEHTPVDTSQLLSNWQLSIGRPEDDFVSPRVPGQDGSTAKASAAETLTLARRTLKLRQPGQPLYLSNSAPYVAVLNRTGGGARNDPPGFVEAAVLIGRRVTANVKVDYTYLTKFNRVVLINGEAQAG